MSLLSCKVVTIKLLTSLLHLWFFKYHHFEIWSRNISKTVLSTGTFCVGHSLSRSHDVDIHCGQFEDLLKTFTFPYIYVRYSSPSTHDWVLNLPCGISNKDTQNRDQSLILDIRNTKISSLNILRHFLRQRKNDYDMHSKFSSDPVYNPSTRL